MNGAAAKKQRRLYGAARRAQKWATRPDVYPGWWPIVERRGQPFPKNSHLPRYCARVQDPLARRPNEQKLYDVCIEHAKVLEPKKRWLLEASITDLCFWLGQVLNQTNQTSTVAKEPIPRSTLCYWLARLFALHLIERFDITTERPIAKKRRKGDGRHKSYFVVNSYEVALLGMADDPEIATPVNRTFWTWNGWPISTRVADMFGLVAAVAEQMPEAWANNQRSKHVLAPMKPIRPTRSRWPSDEETDEVHRVLMNWGVDAKKEHAAQRIAWAWDAEPLMPAKDLASRMNNAMFGKRQLDRQAQRPSFFSLQFFPQEQIHAIAARWRYDRDQELKREAEAALAAERAAEAVKQQPAEGTGPDPPEDFIPRKDWWPK